MNTMWRVLFPVILLWSCNRNPGTITPQVKPLMEAVYASGFVVSEQEYQVFSQADGTLAEIVVPAGEVIKKGAPILKVRSVQTSARYAQARETYRQALKNKEPVLAELTATLRSARTKAQFDSTNLVRYTSLLKSNATSRIEYDKAELQYKNSQNDYAAIQNRLAKTRTDLEAAIQNAYNQLLIAEEESGNYIVRSDIDGVVLNITKEPGELIRRSEVIAVVGKPGNFYLKLTVDELDVQRVKAGQTALIKIDALSGDVLKGKVIKVYPLVDTRQQSLRVDVAFDAKPAGLVSGLAAEVNLVIQQKEKTLVIPKQFLLPGDSLWVLQDGSRRKVKVIRGIETLDEVEITSGLSAESMLIQKP
ncbi:MAG: HlyD family efflux transporter periplasmic adaptor subunit [Cyclobacteriaceae bacterium]|nr:HlyD family efflux transporter periplasmic adaptor subunit [Cyclobacteriaceae bacterium]